MELVDAVRVDGRDVAEAHVFADDGGVLGLDQLVVAGLAGAPLGLLDEQLAQQSGYGLVDELRAVVGAEALDCKRELAQDRLQHGQQVTLTDERGCGYNLPLRHLIDGVDMVEPLAFGRVALMHRVDAQIARNPVRRGLAAFADRHLRGPRLLIMQHLLAIAGAAPQVVQMAVRDRRQPGVPADRS